MLWDLSNNIFIGKLKGHPLIYFIVSFKRNGNQYHVSGRADRIRILEECNVVVKTIEGHRGRVRVLKVYYRDTNHFY